MNNGLLLSRTAEMLISRAKRKTEPDIVSHESRDQIHCLENAEMTEGGLLY